jgi:hypothetical protein
MSGRIDPRRQAIEHAEHLIRKRSRGQNSLLRPTELRRRDHLHRLGDLLRRPHRANAASDVNQ